MNGAEGHTNGVDIREPRRNIGGRPAKLEEEKATIKLNCWVTRSQHEQLQLDYVRVKAGIKLSFAAYLKQKLLNKATVTRSKTDELILTLLINLQERGQQLDTISQKIEAKNGAVEIETSQRVAEEIAAIQETLTNISRWLYES